MKHHDKSKHAGAITILTKVLQKKGVTGWYQVSVSLRQKKAQLQPHMTGHERADYESRTVASTAVHVEGTVRAMGGCYHVTFRQIVTSTIID